MSDATLSAAAPPAHRTRPYYWSLRRELWETRSIFIAPAVVVGVMIIGFLGSAIGMAERRVQTLKLDPIHQAMVIGQPYAFTHAAITGVMILVAWFYCLGALYNERRDRSVLFWKSLPVSDLTTILAKVTIPFIVVPIVTYVATVVAEAVILLASTMILLAGGVSTAMPWGAGDIAAQGVVVAYSLIALCLWHAPVYGWLILVSAWAKKAPFLWAVLPPLAICLIEKLAFGGARFAAMLYDRLGGSENHAMAAGAGFMVTHSRGAPIVTGPSGLAAMDPGKFFSTPGLWAGLVIAAVFVAAAVWLRRRREPI